MTDNAESQAVRTAMNRVEPSSTEFESLSDSWQRSAQAHRIDPESRESPRILTEGSLRRLIDAIEEVVLTAQTELDRLHKIVGQTGYVTLLCDSNGVAINHRGNERRASEFRRWGTWLGGVWSEDIEGTNGIGTCIAERRPLTVHQNQHFRARHTPLSCSGAPVFDADVRLIAVVDVSSINPTLSAQAHALTLPLVSTSARLIEERLFRKRFRKAWIVAVAAHEDQPAALLAVDRDHRLLAADHQARTRFRIDPESLSTGTSLWAIFSRKHLLIQKGARADYPVRLTPDGADESLFALVSPPVTSVGRIEATMLMQPRLELLDDLRRRFGSTAAPPRGGLAPRALRRVTEYVESHLSEALSIETLAAQAGLSTHHFARAFKKSAGMPPHRYLLQQRIKRSAQLLRQTKLPLTSIAQMVGFTDQSHFSRSFRWHVGPAPSEYRRSHQ